MQPVNILFVEDHAPTRTAVALQLEQGNHVVITARTAEEAMMLIEDFAFDLVISDIGLPDLSGLDLMAHIRKTRPGLLGIAMTAYGTDADIERSRAAGFSDHLVKPVSIERLQAAIRALPLRKENGANGSG